jgi:hypothetical protein
MSNLRNITLASLLLAAAALPLWAAPNVQFQGNCTTGLSCQFDATKAPAGFPTTTCAPSGVLAYHFDFDEIVSGEEDFTTSPTSSYVYTGSYCGNVKVTVYCHNGSWDEQVHCLCPSLAPAGCIQPGSGWTP